MLQRLTSKINMKLVQTILTLVKLDWNIYHETVLLMDYVNINYFLNRMLTVTHDLNSIMKFRYD